MDDLELQSFKRIMVMEIMTECDLERYWEILRKPMRDYTTLHWIASQCRGIVDAVAHVHRRIEQGVPISFEIHGDIRPANVMWLKKDARGVLVLHNPGGAAANRSNVPEHSIPDTLDYRPPEYDMDRGVSRSFDIWTLGCLFLEFVVWTLCGWDERERFKIDRLTPHFNGEEKSIYYEVWQLVGGNQDAYAFKVKDAVIKASRELSMQFTGRILY